MQCELLQQQRELVGVAGRRCSARWGRVRQEMARVEEGEGREVEVEGVGVGGGGGECCLRLEAKQPMHMGVGRNLRLQSRDTNHGDAVALG